MKYFNIIKEVFEKRGITEFGLIKVEDLLVQKEHILKDIDRYRSCIIFCIPYKTRNNCPDNISKYAAVYDYHYFFKDFSQSIVEELKARFPAEDFVGFCDHSPINERDAALKSGLGIIGKNSMLINEKYGSYIFLGSVFSTLDTQAVSKEVRRCSDCGKCVKACPTGSICGDFDKCLSYITQKKKKTEKDIEIIKSNKYVWGCDICQDVCPYNEKCENSNIPFFEENIINHLTTQHILEMDDDEFLKRAFSWRGKNTILENLSLFDE